MVATRVEAELGTDRIELGMVEGNSALVAVARRAGFEIGEGIACGATLDGAVADEPICELVVSKSEGGEVRRDRLS